MVVNVDPSAQLYDGAYLDLTKRTEDLDLFNSSFPMPIIKANHKLITARVRAHDKPILDALEAKGLIFSGEWAESGLMEIVEIKDHPFMLGSQFHPEFTSNPRDGHPLFAGFVIAARQKHSGQLPKVAQA